MLTASIPGSHTHRALFPQALDLAIRVDLIVLQDGHLDLLPLVLDLLRSIVGLLLALLGTTAKPAIEMRQSSTMILGRVY
jgi:hypothetical protein